MKVGIDCLRHLLRKWAAPSFSSVSNISYIGTISDPSKDCEAFSTSNLIANLKLPPNRFDVLRVNVPGYKLNFHSIFIDGWIRTLFWLMMRICFTIFKTVEIWKTWQQNYIFLMSNSCKLCIILAKIKLRWWFIFLIMPNSTNIDSRRTEQEAWNGISWSTR